MTGRAIIIFFRIITSSFQFFPFRVLRPLKLAAVIWVEAIKSLSSQRR